MWWLSISSSLYVIVLSDLIHCEREIAKGPLVWGINLGALAFIIGSIMLFGILDADEAWRWISWNLLAIVPLGIFGLATNQIFLLILCAIGWLMDSFKIASVISNATGSDGSAPIYFIVLGISGLLIAGAGWLLSKHQDEVHGVLSRRMERCSVSRRIFPEDSGHVAVQTEEVVPIAVAVQTDDDNDVVC